MIVEITGLSSTYFNSYIVEITGLSSTYFNSYIKVVVEMTFFLISNE